MDVWMNGTNPEGKPHKNDQNKEAKPKTTSRLTQIVGLR